MHNEEKFFCHVLRSNGYNPQYSDGHISVGNITAAFCPHSDGSSGAWFIFDDSNDDHVGLYGGFNTLAAVDEMIYHLPEPNGVAQ